MVVYKIVFKPKSCTAWNKVTVQNHMQPIFKEEKPSYLASEVVS